MRIWVRSQYKTILVKADTFQYCYDDNKYIVMCNGVPFGFYKSKERCIEIIDEIQKLLMQGDPKNWFVHITNCEMPTDEAIELLRQVKECGSVVTNGRAGCEVTMPSVVVYEMPKE